MELIFIVVAIICGVGIGFYGAQVQLLPKTRRILEAIDPNKAEAGIQLEIMGQLLEAIEALRLWRCFIPKLLPKRRVR